jgi:hypothetical protein
MKILKKNFTLTSVPSTLIPSYSKSLIKIARLKSLFVKLVTVMSNLLFYSTFITRSSGFYNSIINSQIFNFIFVIELTNVPNYPHSKNKVPPNISYYPLCCLKILSKFSA